MDPSSDLGIYGQSFTRWDIVSRLRVDLMAAGTAAISITPIVCLIDSIIMRKAATSCSFASTLKKFVWPLSKVPTSLVFSPIARLVFCVYFGTYLTANTIDTLTSVTHAQPPETVSSSTAKFLGTATVSTALTVYKDSRMAQILGKSGTKLVVPPATYTLFAVRDAITIFASFNLPPLLAPRLAHLPEAAKDKLGSLVRTEASRLMTAQFLLPAACQFVTTPIHLLGLDLYNRRHKMSAALRFERVARDYGTAVPARMARIVPAFGVGGVLNTEIRRRYMQDLS